MTSPLSASANARLEQLKANHEDFPERAMRAAKEPRQISLGDANEADKLTDYPDPKVSSEACATLDQYLLQEAGRDYIRVAQKNAIPGDAIWKDGHPDGKEEAK